MILGFGLIVYFCCLRRRPKSTSAAAEYHDPDEVFSFPSSRDSQPTPGTAVTVNGYAPAFDPQVPVYPFPVEPNPNNYPVSNSLFFFMQGPFKSV